MNGPQSAPCQQEDHRHPRQERQRQHGRRQVVKVAHSGVAQPVGEGDHVAPAGGIVAADEAVIPQVGHALLVVHGGSVGQRVAQAKQRRAVGGGNGDSRALHAFMQEQGAQGWNVQLEPQHRPVRGLQTGFQPLDEKEGILRAGKSRYIHKRAADGGGGQQLQPFVVTAYLEVAVGTVVLLHLAEVAGGDDVAAPLQINVAAGDGHVQKAEAAGGQLGHHLRRGGHQLRHVSPVHVGQPYEGGVRQQLEGIGIHGGDVAVHGGGVGFQVRGLLAPVGFAAGIGGGKENHHHQDQTDEQKSRIGQRDIHGRGKAGLLRLPLAARKSSHIQHTHHTSRIRNQQKAAR